MPWQKPWPVDTCPWSVAACATRSNFGHAETRKPNVVHVMIERHFCLLPLFPPKSPTYEIPINFLQGVFWSCFKGITIQATGSYETNATHECHFVGQRRYCQATPLSLPRSRRVCEEHGRRHRFLVKEHKKQAATSMGLWIKVDHGLDHLFSSHGSGKPQTILAKMPFSFCKRPKHWRFFSKLNKNIQKHSTKFTKFCTSIASKALQKWNRWPSPRSWAAVV